MSFQITRRTTHPAAWAWERLTDWERHGGLIPFTTVTMLPGPTSGVGSGFNARTSIGPFHFDDPMVITFWQPPNGPEAGICRIVKQGRAVTGWAVLTVTPGVVDGGAVVVWRESATVAGVGALLAWPNAVLGKLVFVRLVDALLSD